MEYFGILCVTVSCVNLEFALDLKHGMNGFIKTHLPTIRRNHGWKDVRGHSKCIKLEIYKITGDSHSQSSNNKKPT